MAAEHIRHWKIGDVEVARIVEVNAWEDDISMLLPDGKAEYVQKFPWLVPHFATPAGKMLISFQCFVLRSRGKSVMIDTCIGSDRKREYDVFCNLHTTFLEDLTAAGFPPARTSTTPWAASAKVSSVPRLVSPIMCGVSDTPGWSKMGWCAGGSGSNTSRPTPES